MATEHNTECNCGCSIGLRWTEPTRLGLSVEETHIGMSYQPTLVIGSGGSSEALEELFGLPESVHQLVIGSDTDIYRTLQDIVPSMDITLSTQQAAEFTSKTQAICGKDTSIGESVEQGNGSELEQFFGVVEPKECQWMTTEEVCQTLEQIMQTIDPELTATMAQTITQNTQQA